MGHTYLKRAGLTIGLPVLVLAIYLSLTNSELPDGSASYKAALGLGAVNFCVALIVAMCFKGASSDTQTKAFSILAVLALAGTYYSFMVTGL